MRKERENAKITTTIKMSSTKYSFYTVNCTNEDMILDKIH
jgi:hypothetical protein